MRMTPRALLLVLLVACQLLSAARGSTTTAGNQQSHHRPQCYGAPGGIALVTFAVTEANAHQHDKQQHVVRWMSVSNKRAYAATHDYTLYVSSVRLQHAKHMVWDKFVIIKAVMQHSCAEWLWVLDSDAFIMNLGVDLKKIITAAVAQHTSTSVPDVIIAKDCNGINAGSFLVRNAPWTWQHLSDAWAANNASEIEEVVNLREQAALKHMIHSISGVAAHYAFVPQASINAYTAAVVCRLDRPYKVSTQKHPHCLAETV